MLVLIDETGCPGFKLAKGSTAYFIVAMVIFTDFFEAEKASKCISELRQKLKIYPEFKFSKTRAAIKDEFFSKVCQFNFVVRALVVNKNVLYSQHLRSKSDSFYNYFLTMLINDNNSLQNALIKIDGSGNSDFRRALGVYLRNGVGPSKIKTFKFIDSKKDNLIQLADMVVGAIGRRYNPKRDNFERWYNMLKETGKIQNIWDFR